MRKLDTTRAKIALIRARLGKADASDAAELVFLANLIKNDGHIHGTHVVTDGIDFLRKQGKTYAAKKTEISMEKIRGNSMIQIYRLERIK